MKETVMFAKYNQAGNKAVYDILSNMPNDEREKDRASYFGSLSSLFRHLLGGTRFFMEAFKGALASNPAALKAIAAAEGLPMWAEGALTEAQWKELGSTLETIDAAYVALAESLGESDLSLPVSVEWLGDKPVPLSYMLGSLLVHNTHHRGQVSQILDSLKIDNDYSGIAPSFV